MRCVVAGLVVLLGCSPPADSGDSGVTSGSSSGSTSSASSTSGADSTGASTSAGPKDTPPADLGSPTDNPDCGADVQPQDAGVVFCVVVPVEGQGGVYVPADSALVRIYDGAVDDEANWELLQEVTTGADGVAAFDTVMPMTAVIQANTPPPVGPLGCWETVTVATELLNDGAVLGLILDDIICT